MGGFIGLSYEYTLFCSYRQTDWSYIFPPSEIMGSSKSKEEEIVINQNQQQQQQPQQFGSSLALSTTGIGPLHVLAAVAVLLLLALCARFLWRLISREIRIQAPRRAESVATIV